MTKKKHVNPKDFLHQVYTEEKGVKQYNKNQRTIGMLELAIGLFASVKIGRIFDKIENLEIKALKKGDD